MSDIGSLMAASDILRDGVSTPATLLRKEIDLMRSELVWLEKNHPGVNTTKKWEHLHRLDIICQSLERSGPISVWKLIWERLGEAKRDNFSADIALVYFPLKSALPAYHASKQIVVDMCGYNLMPLEYDYCRGKLFARWLNDEEGQP